MSTTEYRITERPIAGDINPGDVNDTEQITKEEFLALVDAVLDLPHVTALKWDQYTPYFNDGEPCTFGINDGRIVFDFSSTEDEDSETEYDDGSYLSYDLYHQGRGVDWRLNGPRTFEVNGINTEPHYNALSEFDRSARWERVAQLSFGDHAEVTATKEGFSVEYYDHD